LSRTAGLRVDVDKGSLHSIAVRGRASLFACAEYLRWGILAAQHRQIACVPWGWPAAGVTYYWAFGTVGAMPRASRDTRM